MDEGTGVKTIVYNTKKYSKGGQKEKDKKKEKERERESEEIQQ